MAATFDLGWRRCVCVCVCVTRAISGGAPLTLAFMVTRSRMASRPRSSDYRKVIKKPYFLKGEAERVKRKRPEGGRAERLDGTVLSTHNSHNSQGVFYECGPNSSSKYVNYVHVWLLLLTAPPKTL